MTCYPRRSETFIAQELLGLERAGLDFEILSLDTPPDEERHDVNREITAKVHYLPNSMISGLPQFVAGWWKARKLPGYKRARSQFFRDYRRDLTVGRVRRFVQAMVIATRHADRYRAFHAHFLHKPASVVRYLEMLTDKPWSASAHAKDIWTSPDWDLADKLEHAHWVVTCSGHAFDRLKSLADGDARVYLSYHGLDLDRFGPRTTDVSRRDGADPGNPVRILSVARAVEKKGLDTLFDALAALPADFHWRLTHVGYGPVIDKLKAQAERLGLMDRITWKGSLPQTGVLALYRESDLFVLPCRVAADGDRDGVPNVLVEAASQRLASISTTVSGVPELITHDETGYLVEPDQPEALSRAILLLGQNPDLRARLGAAAEQRVRTEFDHRRSVAFLYDLLKAPHAG
ncbi:MAG: glycosyltransferase family 4 protein [Hyphomicrobiales bacterium]